MHLESNNFQNESEASTFVLNSQQILAHYKIELQKQKNKLRQKTQTYQQQIRELQIQIRNSSRIKQSKKQDTYLKNQLDFKKAQIENLKIVLLKITDKKSYNTLNNIDQALILQQTPDQIIKQKQKIIKQLSQQLAIAQQKFQGKYFIEHKAINQFQVQMHQNKKLKAYVLQNQKERQFYAKNQTNKQKTIAATAFYNRQYKNQEKKYEQLSQILSKFQLEDIKQFKKQQNFYQTELRYLQTIQSQYLHLNGQLEEQINNVQKQIDFHQKAFDKLQNQNNQFEKKKQKPKIIKNVRNLDKNQKNKLNSQEDFQQSQSNESNVDSISNTLCKQKLDWNLGISRQVDQSYNIKTTQKNKINTQNKKQKYQQFGLDDIYNHK